MSILTGLIGPSSGTAMIGSKNIQTQTRCIRQSFLCPKHDLFFVDLTVAEHLKFFVRVKGWSSSQVKSQAPQLLAKLNLVDKGKVKTMKPRGDKMGDCV